MILILNINVMSLFAFMINVLTKIDLCNFIFVLFVFLNVSAQGNLIGY